MYLIKIIVDYSNELRELIERIEHLEFQLHSFSSKKVDDLHLKVNDLCQKLEVLLLFIFFFFTTF